MSMTLEFGFAAGTIQRGNLLSTLAWTAGASTTLSIAGGLARATDTTAATPGRIIKGPFAIQAGKTYKLGGKAYQRTAATNMYIRVSTTADISTGDVFQTTTGGAQTLDLTGQTFTAGASGNVYFGIVPVNVSAGEYGEIDDSFSISRPT